MMYWTGNLQDDLGEDTPTRSGVDARRSWLSLAAAMMLATSGCSSGDAIELVNPGDGLALLLGADSGGFYFTRRDDSGGVLYRGSPSGEPHVALAEGDLGWRNDKSVVHDGYLYYYYASENGLFRIPTTGGAREQLTTNLGVVFAVAVADGTVYFMHEDGISALDGDSRDPVLLNSSPSLRSHRLTVLDGRLVWAAGSRLKTKELAAPGNLTDVYGMSNDCPEDEPCSFQSVEVVGSRDGELLFVEYQFSRHSGKEIQDGPLVWEVRADHGALHALTFGADGAVSVRLVEDDIVLAAVHDGALWGVRRGGEVVGLDPVRELGRSIDVDDELLYDGDYHPRLLATATHLVFPSTDGSIYGVALP
jgi:hypothetical protein